jgi:hypothetical protein
MTSTPANDSSSSKGHAAFLGDFEYFFGDDGDLYRANIEWPVQVDGRRWGRWEAPSFLAAKTLELAKVAFTR